MTTTKITETYRVFFINHGYAVEEPTLEAAIQRGKRSGFEFSVWHGGKILCAWSVFGGMTRYDR